MSKPEKHYDLEFQKNAVNLWIKSGKSARQIAEELGISSNSLSLWKKKHIVEGSPQMELLQEEVARLRSEVLELREERDILKKSVAIFLKPRK